MLMLLSSALSMALLWGLLSCCLLETSETGRLRRRIVPVFSFAAGAGGMLLLLTSTVGDLPFATLRMIIAALLLVMVMVSSATLLSATDRGDAIRRDRFACWSGVAAPFLFPVLYGALATAILAGSPSASRVVVVAATVIAAFLVSSIVQLLIHLVPYRPRFTPLSLFLLANSLLFCTAAFSPRLDLFAPLSMKIMKFTHDFLHQFLESMLLPDHLFINSQTWSFIGFFFSQEIGFWGALLGTVVGIVIGQIANQVLINVYADSFEGYTLFVFTIPSILMVMFLVCTIALLAGVLPAIRASRLNPIESLRYE